MTVAVLLLTLLQLDRGETSRVMFFAGLVIGQVLMCLGAYGMQLADRAGREKRMLGNLSRSGLLKAC